LLALLVQLTLVACCSTCTVVIACSALRATYRETLRRSIPGRVVFLLLDVDAAAVKGALAGV
jgi:gluconate kinase